MDAEPQDFPSLSLSLLTNALNLATRVSAVADGATDARSLAEGVCRLLAEGMPGTLAWIAVAQPGEPRLRLLAQLGPTPKHLDALRASHERDPGAAALAATAIEDGAPQLLLNLETTPLPDPWREPALAQGCRAAVALPLRAAGKAHGVLSLYLQDPNLLDGVGLDVLQIMADHLGQGLRRLKGESERARLLDVLDALRSLTSESLKSHELDPLLHAIVGRAAALLGGSAAGMYLAQPEEQTVRCVVSYPTPPDFTGLVLRYGEGAAGMVAQSGKPMIIPDYPHWPRRLDSVELVSLLQALLCAPMVAQGQVIGVIHIWRSAAQPPFSQDDVEILSLFANQAAVVLENARHLQASQQRLEQFTLLSEITCLALEARDPSQLLQAMAEPLARLVEADVCYLALRPDRSASVAVPETAQSLTAVFSRAPASSAVPAQWERLLASSQPTVVAEVPVETGPNATADILPPIRSLLALPLRAAGRHLGGVLLGSNRPRRFSVEEIGACQQAADQLALALSKGQALEAEQRRSAELEALRQANLRLTSKLDLQRVLETILEQAIGLLGADDAHFFLYDGQQITFGAALWAGGFQGQPYANPRPEGLTYTVARTGCPLVVPDVNRHPLFKDYQWGGAIVGLPLRIGDQTRGVMTVAFDQPRPFTASDLRPMELLADQAAIALENAQLFESTAAERKRLQLLYDITRALGTSLDPLEILQRATALTTASLNGLTGAAFLGEPTTGRLRLRALAGKDPERVPELDAALGARVGQGLVGWIAAHKESALVADLSLDPRGAELRLLDEELRTALGAPILAGDEMLGVLMVLHKQPSAYCQEQLDLLAAIARQVGLALTSAKRHQQTQRRLAELTVLQQVGRVINRRLEMQALLEEVVRQVREVLGYPMVEILLVEGDELVLRAGAGSTYPAPTRLSLSEGIVGRVARTNQSAFAPDVRLDPDYIPTIPSTRSEIAVPLRKGGVVFGVLNVESPYADSLTDDDVRLLSLLADQMSVAIENAALYDHLRQHADELERTVSERTASLAEALEKARQADRIKSQFVSDVSHELRTPLSNIRLYLDLLSMGKPERFEDYVETLTRETERLMRLIDDLLAVSRLDAKASAMQLALVDLNDLALGLVEDRQRLFAAKGLILELQPQRDLPPVMGDERMLSQVIANLLTNAMQYTPQGRVTISTALRSLDGRLWSTLTVADTGLGIPDDELPRLFERFFRGANSRTVRASGTGLGLAICKEILDRHGGHITVGSRLGHGSTFTIWLPAGAPAE